MRKILTLFLFAGVARVADAHTLASDDGLPLQLLHQVLGLHHFPLTAILIVAGIVLLKLYHRRDKRNN